MKNAIRTFLLAATVTTVAIPVLAQGTSAPQSGQCAPELKEKIYERFRNNIRADQRVAYEAGKEYLKCFGNETDDITNYVRNFVAKYEQASQKAEVRTRFQQLYSQQKYAEAFPLGKQILAEEPDNLGVMIATAWSGLGAVTSGQDAFIPDAAAITRKTLQELEAGKTPQGATNFNKDETLGWLNYALGIYAIKQNNPREALNYLYKAAQYEGFAKKDPQTYALMAVAYQQAYYEPLAKEYREKYLGKPESPEQQAALAQLNQVIDRVIDAYARAVAYANASNDQRYQQRKAEWTEQLAGFYKFRNNDSTTGMDQLIASATTKPLPSPTIPAAAPTPQPAGGTSKPAGGTSSGTSGTSSNSGNTMTNPSATTQATPTTTPKPSMTPTPTPKPQSPTSRTPSSQRP